MNKVLVAGILGVAVLALTFGVLLATNVEVQTNVPTGPLYSTPAVFLDGGNGTGEWPCEPCSPGCKCP